MTSLELGILDIDPLMPGCVQLFTTVRLSRHVLENKWAVHIDD